MGRRRRGGPGLKALVVRDGDIAFEERPTPEPVSDEVLLETAGTGVNRADLLQMRGGYPAPAGWPPDIPGLEVAGTVMARGPSASDFREGDRVFGIVGGGGHSTHVLTRSSLLATVPEGIDLVEAGGVPEVFLTAHDALVTQAGMRAGDRVLVHGVGSGVGTAAVQLAKALGATTVGTARSPEKLRRARDLGLDQGVLASEDMAHEIGGVSIVLDLVGGRYVKTDIEVCAPKGRIIVVGLMAGSETAVDLQAILQKRLTLRGTVLRARPDYEKALAMNAFEAQVVPLLERGVVRPVIDRIVPLEDAKKAYDCLASNANFGKVVLDARTSLRGGG
ncbi:MAG TPA: NAD(P)H-quinone oxidoreductase [Actinomycetota bacterium]|nr:NAD(P)H-quinone oxidoreductase [Actinomycetota bacterium]